MKIKFYVLIGSEIRIVFFARLLHAKCEVVSIGRGWKQILDEVLAAAMCIQTHSSRMKTATE